MRYDDEVRTTVDIDSDLHREAVALARSTRTTLSRLLNDALRQSLHPVAPVKRDDATGIGTISIGRRITSADVAAALEE